MTNLSPAAQAVLQMVNAAPHCGSGRIKAAAALRAAALYCRDRRVLMTIATELEGAQ